jgi:hypothetical protein
MKKRLTPKTVTEHLQQSLLAAERTAEFSEVVCPHQ